MNILKSLILGGLCLVTGVASAQISAKLMRDPDVSDTHIAFVYGGDIWLAAKAGGTAVQLTNSPGEESAPRFSPDGKFIAYTASYDGNGDVYVLPVSGGVPTRVTYQSHMDRVVDWHPDGKRVLFISMRQSGARNTRQFYLVDATGGLPERLPIPYGDLASYSPDGQKIAYVQRIAENYPFKRYRGGLATDVIVFDLSNNTAEKITENDATDGKPAWNGENIFYVSDVAENMRRNVWVYDTNTKEARQLTTFDKVDVNFMTGGPNDLVFEAGGDLYLLDTESMEYSPVKINVISDLTLEMPRVILTGGNINNFSLSPDGKRVALEARGDVYNVPATEGFTRNYTSSSGAFDRNPAWSPDGMSVAYWSDKSGEYEIYIQPTSGVSPARKLTNRNGGFGYTLHWSPDAKKIAFMDETGQMNLLDVATGNELTFGKTDWALNHRSLFGMTLAWSPDSQWISYSKGLENVNEAIFLYNTNTKETHQVTSSFYNNYQPAFSPDGKYLYFLTQRHLQAAYSSFGDGTWIYPNATQIAVVGLDATKPSLLSPKNDSVSLNDSEKEEAAKTEDSKVPPVRIDLEGFESRLTILPPAPGNIDQLMPTKDKLLYVRYPNTGSSESTFKLQYYHLEDRKEETILDNVQGVELSASGDKVLVRSQGKLAVIKPEPGQLLKKMVPTADMAMTLYPKEEWHQLFNDTWRRYRDFFYDADMQQVDWQAMKDQYLPLVEDARSRWDVTNILVELISELSAGHTYAGGGDTESVMPRMTGNLGIDWKLTDGKFQIARIVEAAEWDHEVRSPLKEPGVNVNEGDYILAVNGVALDVEKDPYAALEGLSDKTVSLTISSSGKPGETREVVIHTLTPDEESRLRHLAWIEDNRKKVDELSEGRLGYMYMPNTAGLGQQELMRMFYGQIDKEGFVIDERFNGGGQLSDRFMEMLTRPTLFNLHWRHGRDHQWPLKANDGPKAMLINGSAGSGGDAFPWAFQVLDAGPIIGERTLGILVGPATGHSLIDGGFITVPDARLYQNNGEWFWEGYGVSPDIEVWDDPEQMAKGIDPQLERAVSEVLKILEENPNEPVPAPPYEDRTAEGLGNKD